MHFLVFHPSHLLIPNQSHGNIQQLREKSTIQLDLLIKPGTRGQRLHAPGFLKLLWFTHWYACVSSPEGINNQWRDMV